VTLAVPTDAAQHPTSARGVVRRALPYASAVASIALALAGAFALDRYGITSMQFPLFLLAVASTFWSPGVGPAIVAAALSAVAFNYFFTAPRHSLLVEAADLPYYVSFLLLALMLVYRKRREDQMLKLNALLERRRTELEAVNAELEAFAYSVSHDLRAPLRHMVGFAELLQQHAAAALDERSRRYVATIVDATKRMGQLVDDLLSFSRIGRVEKREATVSLEQLVTEVVREIRPDAGARAIAWRIGALPDLHADRSMLRLVFVNLLANAVKFTRPRDQAEIEVGAFERERDVVVFVKDNGVGFDMKYLNKLFGVFQRLHRSEDFEGTGIGLATVQRVVHRHGGTVWAEGAVNAGATFFFSVPQTAKR
jgi:signal transduction histidine kinase